jgi:hypothetical protein
MKFLLVLVLSIQGGYHYDETRTYDSMGECWEAGNRILESDGRVKSFLCVQREKE